MLLVLKRATLFFSAFDMDNLGKICQHHWNERITIQLTRLSKSPLQFFSWLTTVWPCWSLLRSLRTYERLTCSSLTVNLPSLKVLGPKWGKIELCKVAKIYTQTFVWWGKVCVPHHTNKMSVKFCNFDEYMLYSFQQITFKLGNCTDWKALFPTDFP